MGSLSAGTRYRGRALLVAGIAAIALVAAGCGGATNSGTAVQGGTATFAEFSGAAPNWIFPFIDSAHNSTPSVEEFEHLMYRPLYWFGTDGQPAVDPSRSLADPPQYQGNGTKVVLNLKPYAWSNGEKLKPQDIVFWMNMMFAEKANWAVYVPGEFPDNVKSVDVTGPMQVTFSLDQPYSAEWFSNDELQQIYPMPAEWDKTSDSAAAGSGGCTRDRGKCAAVYQYLYNKSTKLSGYATDPLWQVVDGPWKLKSFTTDGNITFVPNSAYSGPIKPKLSQFVELPFTTDESEFNVLRSGNTIDVGRIPINDAPQRSLSSSDPLPPANPLGANKFTLAPEHLWSWSFGLENYANPKFGAAFKQLYLRQALQETIDQQTDAQIAWRGFALPTTGPVPTVPKTKYLAPIEQSSGPNPFDLNKAQNLLTSHGWTEQDGVMTCTNPGNGPDQCGASVPAGLKLNPTLEYENGVKSLDEVMQQWKSDASKIGIDITLKALPFNTVIADLTSCPQKPSTCGWELGQPGAGELYQSADPTGEMFFLPGAAANHASVNDPTLTQLVTATVHSNDPQAFSNYENYVAQQLPGEFDVPATYRIWAISTTLRGITPFDPYDGITPEDWYLTK